jgi:hypothetical protein
MVSFCPIFQLFVLYLKLLNVPSAKTYSKYPSGQLGWRWRGELVRGGTQRTQLQPFCLDFKNIILLLSGLCNGKKRNLVRILPCL